MQSVARSLGAASNVSSPFPKLPSLGFVPGPRPEGKGRLSGQSTTCLISHVGAAPDRVRAARAHTRPAPCFSPLFLPLPSPDPPRGGGETRELELGLSQWAGGPRARPPPSLRRGPIGIYYNVVASGRGAGRGSRGRAGCGPAWPRLAEGRREGARRGCCSLAPSLPQPVGLVSQPAARRPASRRGPEPRTPAPPPAIVRLAVAAAGAGARARELPVRRGGGGARAAVWGAGGAPLSPEGTVQAAAAAPQPLCLQPPAGPGLGALAAPWRGLVRTPERCGAGAGTRLEEPLEGRVLLRTGAGGAF